MKVVITGSSGFVGQNLSPYLKDLGYHLFFLSLRGLWQDNLPLEYDSVIYLAGKAHDTANAVNPEEYFEVNVELTKQVFDKFLQNKASDFIYFSSVKAVADRVNGTLDENEVPNPRTPYGQSKRKAEEYILSRKLPDGKRVIILRPCMIHGPTNKGNLNLLFKIVKKGIPWPLTAFENRRSFLSIYNLCYLVGAIIGNKGMPSGIYNCADDEPLATNELVALIAESLGKKPKFWYIPERIVNGIAITGDIFRLPLNTERLKKLTESYVVSNEKLKTALGIEKLPVPVREGLRRTFNNFVT